MSIFHPKTIKYSLGMNEVEISTVYNILNFILTNIMHLSMPQCAMSQLGMI